MLVARLMTFFLFLLPLDYANSRCQSYEIDTNSRSGRKKLEKDSIVNFFEKICLRGGKSGLLFFGVNFRRNVVFMLQCAKISLTNCATQSEVGLSSE